MRIHKCNYKHCSHEAKEINPEDEMKDGSKYFHKDCLDLKNGIIELRNYYFENIDKKADFVALSVVLNNLILKQHINIDFMRFVLHYCVEKKISTLIKSPYTLYYLPKNQKYINAYNTYKRKMDNNDN